MLIAFDLDGVLYTTEPFLADAYRESIALVNELRPGSFAEVPTKEEIFRHIGWPVPTILSRLFPNAAPEAMKLMYEITLDVICRRVKKREGVLFDGVPETISTLAGEGHDLVVASNGRRPYVEAVLSTYRLAEFFAPLLAVGGVIADKIDLLRTYVERHKRRSDEVLMVGDRASDVEAAEAVGCRFVGCDYGHGHLNEIAGRGAIVSSFGELLALVRTMADGAA